MTILISNFSVLIQAIWLHITIGFVWLILAVLEDSFQIFLYILFQANLLTFTTHLIWTESSFSPRFLSWVLESLSFVLIEFWFLSVVSICLCHFDGHLSSTLHLNPWNHHNNQVSLVSLLALEDHPRTYHQHLLVINSTLRGWIHWYIKRLFFWQNFYWEYLQ